MTAEPIPFAALDDAARSRLVHVISRHISPSIDEPMDLTFTREDIGDDRWLDALSKTQTNPGESMTLGYCYVAGYAFEGADLIELSVPGHLREASIPKDMDGCVLSRHDLVLVPRLTHAGVPFISREEIQSILTEGFDEPLVVVGSTGVAARMVKKA